MLSFSLGLLPSLLISGKIFAQGAAVIMPMSTTKFNADESVEFVIHNRQEQELTLSYSPHCDIDGTELEGAACGKFFLVDFNPPLKAEKLLIPARSRVAARVSITNKKVRYGLFKPLFKPQEEQSKTGVGLNFNYQPGYLYLLNPSPANFDNIKFDTYVHEKVRRARFVIDLSKLSMPHLISVSAKILDKSSKKLLRFVRLASDKIADPRRVHLDLESEFDEYTNKNPVCYELYIQINSTKELKKVEGCEAAKKN